MSFYVSGRLEDLYVDTTMATVGTLRTEDTDEVKLSTALRAMKGKPSSHEAMTEVAKVAFNWGSKIQW